MSAKNSIQLIIRSVTSTFVVCTTRFCIRFPSSSTSNFCHLVPPLHLFLYLPSFLSLSLSRLLVGLSVSFVCCLVAGVSVYFLCILNAITFIFCNNICAHRCRFSFGFIALDFPTEFSALFDSCGVIINLNNEIPKWNPIYNSFAVPAFSFSFSLSMQYICFLCKFLTLKSSPKNRAHKMFQLIFCYQKLSLWNNAQNYFLWLKVFFTIVLRSIFCLRVTELIWILWFLAYCMTQCDSEILTTL